jgi:hypothetical protein
LDSALVFNHSAEDWVSGHFKVTKKCMNISSVYFLNRLFSVCNNKKMGQACILMTQEKLKIRWEGVLCMEGKKCCQHLLDDDGLEVKLNLNLF